MCDEYTPASKAPTIRGPYFCTTRGTLTGYLLTKVFGDCKHISPAERIESIEVIIQRLFEIADIFDRGGLYYFCLFVLGHRKMKL